VRRSGGKPWSGRAACLIVWLVPQVKTPLLTKAAGYEVGMRSEPLPNLKFEVALFVLNLASEATFDGDEALTTPGRPSQRKGIELAEDAKRDCRPSFPHKAEIQNCQGLTVVLDLRFRGGDGANTNARRN
jgi:hypothetical protein